MADSESLGERLRIARVRAKLTQAQIAERLGVSKQSVSAWERDATLPSAENLASLAALYGASRSSLRYGNEVVAQRDGAGNVDHSLPRVAGSHAVRVWQKEFELELVRAGAPEELVRDAMALVSNPSVFTWYAGTGQKALSEEEAIEAMEALATVTRVTYSKRFGLKFTNTAKQ